MIVNHICRTTDYEYDSQIAWWLDQINPDLPDVHRVEYVRDTLDSIDTQEPFILLAKGNEEHENLDRFYSDSRVLAIIKSYPAMKNTAPEDQAKNGIRMLDYVFRDDLDRFVYPVLPEDPRTINIPLGFCNGFKPYQNYNREISLFFNGQYSEVRYDILKNYDDLNILGRSPVISFYKGFGGDARLGDEGDDGHYDIDTYSRCLGNALISACISGASPETYRLSESAASGCMILSGPLPDVEYYNTLPGIICPNDKMTDPDFINHIAEAVPKFWPDTAYHISEWYNKFIAPKAVAERINNHLRKIL